MKVKIYTPTIQTSSVESTVEFACLPPKYATGYFCTILFLFLILSYSPVFTLIFLKEYEYSILENHSLYIKTSYEQTNKQTKNCKMIKIKTKISLFVFFLCICAHKKKKLNIVPSSPYQYHRKDNNQEWVKKVI